MQSHPMWVRGLKLDYAHIGIDRNLSHPMWVRGLKPSRYISTLSEQEVAPHVGAWIETISLSTIFLQAKRSHPMWVRGLKHYVATRLRRSVLSHPMWVRGLKRLTRST